MSLVSPILVSEKQTNDQALFDNLLLEHHYSVEKQCVTLPLPTDYHTEEEEEEEEEDEEDDDDDSCDQRKSVVGKIKPSTSSTRLDITPRVNTKVVKNPTSFPPVEVPVIQTYSPQLNLSLYSPSIRSSIVSRGPVSAAPTPSPLVLPSITMDIQSPPQPTQSTSRFKNAFQRLRGSSFSRNSSVVPIELPPMKPVPSKSSSLAEKIKNKFHHHQQEKKKKRENKKLSSTSSSGMPRSSSLSSITNWSRRGNKKNTIIHSTSVTSGISSSSSCSNTSSSKEDPRLRQPLRAVNVPVSSFSKGNKPKGSVGFAKLVSVRDTYSKEEYNRCSDPDAICNRLSADMAQQIKEELNAFKLHEMPVHEYSRENTHFFI